VVIGVVAAVAVALLWLPKPQMGHAARASTPTEITLAISAEGLAIQVEHGGLALTFEF